MKMSKKNREDFEREIFECVLKTIIEDELLEKPELGKNSSAFIRDHAINKLRRIAADKKIEFVFSIDHTEKLLGEARTSKKIDSSLAAFWYATYIEHKLNFIIHMAAKKAKLSKKTSDAILRKTTIEDKCSWVLELLNIKQIDSRHVTLIKRISEIRNRYIHYKWSYLNEELEKKDGEAVKNIEKTIRYIKSFEERALFKGMRKKFEKK